MARVSKPKSQLKPFVIVRTYSAGVHVGTLDKRRGKEVVLLNARRIWAWIGANTLHEIASTGVGADSKISVAVACITLTEAIEIIHATEASKASIEKCKW